MTSAVFAVSPPTERSRSSAIAGTIRTELTLRLRNPTLPVLLAFTFAICALLVPDPAASYAVITFGGKKPIMSADTALVAAGIVFGAVLMPVYALALDIGNARDRRNLLDRLYLTSPASGALVASGRIVANMIFVLLTIVLALVVVSSTIFARYDTLPAPQSVAIFLLMVIPVGMFSALLAATLDRFFPERNGVKSALAFAVWMAVVATSITMSWDLIGISYLRDAIASVGGRSNFSVGFISTEGMPSVPWQVAPLRTGFLLYRLVVLLMMSVIAGGIGFLLRINPGSALRAAASSRLDYSGTVLPVTATTQSRPIARREEMSLGVPLAIATASALVTTRNIVTRWLRRSRIVWVAIALTILLGLFSGTPGGALAVALTIPMIVASSTTVREARVAATLEMTTAAFFRPSPALMHGAVLALLALIPALPALVRMPAVQAATALLGVLASSMWLTWTHRCIARPLLGVSLLAAIWYANAFNDVPARADILGLWHTSSIALLFNTVIACGMILLVGNHDRALSVRRQ